MTPAEVLVAALAAIGGAGGVVQIIRAIRAYRDGVRLREDEADERLVKRLESRILVLETRADLAADYERLLVHALGAAGIPIPSRKTYQDGEG